MDRDDSQRYLATRKLLRAQELHLSERMLSLPGGSSELPDDMITALVEMEDLRLELEFLENDSPDFGDADPFQAVPAAPESQYRGDSNNSRIGRSRLTR